MADDSDLVDAIPGLTEQWSRPRKITGVLEQLDMGRPERLHTTKFRKLVRALRAQGIEIRLADDDERVLTENDQTPGAHAKVRLRRPDSDDATLSSIEIENFKSFRQAKLPIAELTMLIGANASGKSNALEALQLLSWMASGRRLAQLAFAVKERELAMRGSARDLALRTGEPVRLGATLEPNRSGRALELQVTIRERRGELRIVDEQLLCPQEAGTIPLYRVAEAADETGPPGLLVEYNNFSRGGKKPRITCVDDQPVFTQLVTPARFGATHEKSQAVIPQASSRVRTALENILFLDPSPREMRRASFIDPAALAGDGGNLSTVLYRLTEEGAQKSDVLDFIRSLPEQDIHDVTYSKGARGDVMVQLVESFGGRREVRDASVLSDGTLRVLAIAAALLSVRPGTLVVIEEIDNGVHPSRADHLLDCIRAVASRRRLRVLLTTHNPALLDVIPDAALPDVVACDRDPEDGSSRLTRIETLARYPELIARGPLGRLVTQGVLDRYLKSAGDDSARRKSERRWLDGFLDEASS